MCINFIVVNATLIKQLVNLWFIHRYYKAMAVSPVQYLMITVILYSINPIHCFQVTLRLCRSCCSMMSLNYVIHSVHLQKYISWVSNINLDEGNLLFNIKLGMFYYQLLNLPPQYRSTLQSIHLVAIAKHTAIQKYDSDEILKPLMDDLKKLEQVNNCTTVYVCIHLSPL